MTKKTTMSGYVLVMTEECVLIFLVMDPWIYVDSAKKIEMRWKTCVDGSNDVDQHGFNEFKSWLNTNNCLSPHLY